MAGSSKKQKLWTTLEHKGPVFHEPYQTLPADVKLTYDGNEIPLSAKAEVAGFYAQLLDTKYIDDNFNTNFFNDWRKYMTDEERTQITDLSKCNFKSIQTYFQDLDKNRTDEEKVEIERKKNERKEEYGYCTMDGVKEQLESYQVERPGLFCGRGENPKNGKVKKRIKPEDVTINCSEGNNPEPVALCALADVEPLTENKWKAVKQDPTVMWLASWEDKIHNTPKYIKLHRSSTLRSNKDRDKFIKARELGNKIQDIRNQYRADWHSGNKYIKQYSVALYFIDTLALRPGNEKEEDQADTVGCCSLRVEHITLPEQNVVAFDFIGKSSIPYRNQVPVDEVVFENLKSFMENKDRRDDLFDQVSATKINTYLKKIVPGFTAKVFRTYNACSKMEEKLNELTDANNTVEDKIKSYNDALGHVAKLLNHKSEETSTSNYIDPRIIVAWCKINEVPIEEVFTNDQLDIFRWAMATESSYRFKNE